VGADGKIEDAKFKTFGCGSAIASRCVAARSLRNIGRRPTSLPPSSPLSFLPPRSSVATEWVKGRSLEECLTIKNTDIASHLKLPPVKLHCSMLAEDAIKAAVRDYASKNNIDVTGGAAAKGEEGVLKAKA
jgi:nitrogen fixation protein NifU and related proteins